MKLLPSFTLLLSSILFSTSNASPTALTPDQIKGLQSLDPREAQILSQALQQQLLKRNSNSIWAKRASDSYAPIKVDCPPQPDTNGPGFIRDASDQSINPQESQYIQSHRQNKQADWNNWLKNAGIGEADIPGGFDNYTSDLSRLPRVGLALSGGGYRAMVSLRCESLSEIALCDDVVRSRRVWHCCVLFKITALSLQDSASSKTLS